MKKIKNTSAYKTFLIILIILSIATIAACIIVTAVPVKRGNKAQKYDLDCVTQLKKNPLQECKK